MTLLRVNFPIDCELDLAIFIAVASRALSLHYGIRFKSFIKHQNITFLPVAIYLFIYLFNEFDKGPYWPLTRR